MTSIDLLAQKYRALRCHHIAVGLTDLLTQAEANELSYLQLAEQLVELERLGRERNRLALNLRKAGFPVIKRLEEFDYRHQSTYTQAPDQPVARLPLPRRARQPGVHRPARANDMMHTSLRH